jgi:hypothetical protein
MVLRVDVLGRVMVHWVLDQRNGRLVVHSHQLIAMIWPQRL